MGRYLLMLVAAATLGAALISFSNRRAYVRTTEQRVESETITLARHAAESGYNVVIGLVGREYAARRPVTHMLVDGGTYGAYDATVTESGRGPLDLAISGKYGDALVRILAERFPLTTLPSPLIVVAEELVFNPVGDDFEIRGVDRRQPGAVGQDDHYMAGPGITASGIAVSDMGLQSAVLDALSDAQRERISGVSNEADVNVARLPDLVQAIYDEALMRGIASPDGHVYHSETIGAPGSPAVLVFYGDVELTGSTRGYGLLIVHGNLTIKDTSRWEGVILVKAEGDEPVNVELKDDAVVVGSLIHYGSGGGLPGGHFDVDVFTRDSDGDMHRAYHKHKYDDKYGVSYIDVLHGPDVERYWEDFKDEYAGRTLRLELFNTSNGSGILQLASPAGTYSVPNCEFFSTTIVPDEVTMLRSSFEDLQQLRGTKPGQVKDDSNRDGAYTIRIYDGSTLVYEVSAYEHTKESRDGYGCGTPPDDPDDDGGGELYGRFNVTIQDNAALYYSEEAIGQIGFALESVKDQWRVRGVLHSNSIIE